LAAFLRNAIDHRVRTRFAARIIHNYRCALRRQMLRYGRSDSFRCTRNYCYLSFQLLHLPVLHFLCCRSPTTALDEETADPDATETNDLEGVVQFTLIV